MIKILVASYLSFGLYSSYLSYLDLRYREMKRRLLLPLLALALLIAMISKLHPVLMIYCLLSISIPMYIVEQRSRNKFILRNNIKEEDELKIDDMGYNCKYGAIDILSIGLFSLASNYAFIYFLLSLAVLMIICILLKKKNLPLVSVFELAFILAIVYEYFLVH